MVVKVGTLGNERLKEAVTKSVTDASCGDKCAEELDKGDEKCHEGNDDIDEGGACDGVGNFRRDYGRSVRDFEE